MFQFFTVKLRIPSPHLRVGQVCSSELKITKENHSNILISGIIQRFKYFSDGYLDFRLTFVSVLVMRELGSKGIGLVQLRTEISIALVSFFVCF